MAEPSKLFTMIDRRLIFLVMLAIMIGTIVFPIYPPIYITDYTKSFYNSIGAIKPGDIVFVYNAASPVTYSQMKNGYTVVLWHLLQMRPKIIFATMSPEGVPLLTSILSDPQITDTMNKLGYKEGVNYTNLGLIFEENALVSLIQDFHQATRGKYIGTWLDAVINGGDIDAILDFTGGYSYKWMAQHFHVAYKTKIYSVAGAGEFPNFLPYISSGQIVAALNGAVGSSEYEILARNAYNWIPSDTVATLGTYSVTHVYLIALIVLGNVGYFVFERKNKKGGVS